MYGLNRTNHRRRRRALFAAPYPRRLIRFNPPLGSLYSSRPCVGKDGAINERKVLPPELLSENVAMLTSDSSAAGGICDVYLVGTCHDSPESRREVKAVIQFLKPQVVFLELCPSRLTVTFVDNDGSTIQLEGTQHDKPNIDGKIIDKMGDVPGAESEFTVAYMQAMKYGAKVILGDRPIEITKKRMAANMSNWDSIKTMYYAMFKKNKLPVDLETSIAASVKESFVLERDQYMSAKILEVACKHNSVVAIVGKAHLAGIQKNWKQPVELERLLSVPANPITSPLLLTSSIGAAFAGAVIISYISFSYK